MTCVNFFVWVPIVGILGCLGLGHLGVHDGVPWSLLVVSMFGPDDCRTPVTALSYRRGAAIEASRSHCNSVCTAGLDALDTVSAHARILHGPYAFIGLEDMYTWYEYA